MTDIFISYRRGDGGWAGRLSSDLSRHFDAFFDSDRDSIDFGDDFPDQIAQALDECRICLAVIGPEWLSEKNLTRLADPKDWVRREIETALTASGRIRTVPVLVGNVPIPDVGALPPTLQPLIATKNALSLTLEKWTTDCELLVGRANGWLMGQAGPVSGRHGMPPVLPYLCDRVEQQDALIDLLGDGSAGRVAHVCIVHGHKWEFHGSFLDRLRYRRVLEDLFDARDVGLVCTTLQWNREKAKAGRYAEVLRRSLKTDVMQRPGATDAQLLYHLGRLPQPLVAVLQVTWQDHAMCGPALVPGLRDAWRALFSEAARTKDAVAVSSMPAVLWINFTYEEDTQALTVDDAAELLPRLTPITPGHIADWLAIDEVKRAAAGYEAQLLALTDDERCCVEKGKVHMLHFVDGVRRILTAA